MRAAFSAYSPKSAAGLCAFSRKIRAGKFTVSATGISQKDAGYPAATTISKAPVVYITGAAGIAQSSFFHVFPSKEALLLELVRRMFGEQFDLAGQHSGAADPVFLYAVETALSLSIATAQRKARSLT